MILNESVSKVKTYQPAYYTSGTSTWFYNNILHLKIMEVSWGVCFEYYVYGVLTQNNWRKKTKQMLYYIKW